MPRANISGTPYSYDYDVESVSMREGILEAVAKLAKFERVRSLKLKFPCFCRVVRDGAGGYRLNPADSQPHLDPKSCELMEVVLEPLKALRSHTHLRLIASQPLISEEGFRRQSWCRTRNTQCQQTVCLTFVAHLDYCARFYASSIPHNLLSVQDQEWLQIKHRESGLWKHPLIEHSLFILWTLTDINRIFIPSALTGNTKGFDVQLKIVSDKITAVEKERTLDSEQLEGPDTKRRKIEQS
ncbi:MAG: hypothetical protein Q9221_005477 [Calogaya cf. arnoldii]